MNQTAPTLQCTDLERTVQCCGGVKAGRAAGIKREKPAANRPAGNTSLTGQLGP